MRSDSNGASYALCRVSVANTVRQFEGRTIESPAGSASWNSLHGLHSGVRAGSTASRCVLYVSSRLSVKGLSVMQVVLFAQASSFRGPGGMWQSLQNIQRVCKV